MASDGEQQQQQQQQPEEPTAFPSVGSIRSRWEQLSGSAQQQQETGPKRDQSSDRSSRQEHPVVVAAAGANASQQQHPLASKPDKQPPSLKPQDSSTTSPPKPGPGRAHSQQPAVPPKSQLITLSSSASTPARSQSPPRDSSPHNGASLEVPGIVVTGTKQTSPSSSSVRSSRANLPHPPVAPKPRSPSPLKVASIDPDALQPQQPPHAHSRSLSDAELDIGASSPSRKPRPPMPALKSSQKVPLFNSQSQSSQTDAQSVSVLRVPGSPPSSRSRQMKDSASTTIETLPTTAASSIAAPPPLPPSEKSWSTTPLVTPAPYVPPSSATTTTTAPHQQPADTLETQPTPQPYIPPPHPAPVAVQPQSHTIIQPPAPPAIQPTPAPAVAAQAVPELPWRPPLPTAPRVPPNDAPVQPAEIMQHPKPVAPSKFPNPPPQLPPRSATAAPAVPQTIASVPISSGPISIVSAERRSFDLLRTGDEHVKIVPQLPPRSRSKSPASLPNLSSIDSAISTFPASAPAPGNASNAGNWGERATAFDVPQTMGEFPGSKIPPQLPARGRSNSPSRLVRSSSAVEVPQLPPPISAVVPATYIPQPVQQQQLPQPQPIPQPILQQQQQRQVPQPPQEQQSIYQLPQATQSMPSHLNLTAYQPVNTPNAIHSVQATSYFPPAPPQRSAVPVQQQNYHAPTTYQSSSTPIPVMPPTSVSSQPTVQMQQPYISHASIPSVSTVSLPISGDDDSYAEAHAMPEMMEDDSDDNMMPPAEETERMAEYPDSSRANRRPPITRSMPHEISCKYDVRMFCISGEYICTSGTVTKVWSVSSGTCVGIIAHEGFKVTAMGFKPSRNLEEEGRYVWMGTKEGGLLEGDLSVMRVTSKRLGVHNSTIKGIYRCGFEMWTMDDDGRVQVWGPDATNGGLPNLNGTPKTQRGPGQPQAAIVLKDTLWVGRNKTVSVFKPSAAPEQTQFALSRPIVATKAVGEITCATTLVKDPEHVYFGHDDGKVSVYSVTKMTCVDVVSISIYKVTAISGVGSLLWVGFRTGMVYVYDVSQHPWTVLKDWKAHEGPVMNIVVDRSSIFKMRALPVVTMTPSDNVLTVWDGMLKHDWLERNMQEHDAEFCSLRVVRALICTWNVGAAKPSDLQNTSTDSKFLKRLLATADDPEIIVFGFQELVELDNKTVTAKSIFKKKKHKDKDNIQQHMSHQYQAWQTRLEEIVRALSSSYTLLRSENLVGLYSCVFVKESERAYIGNLTSSTVKTGLGGLHGNKGAIILRFTLDDTSLCFVNCHLAAGQSHIIPRNNDVAHIMESKIPSPRMGSTESAADIFVGGGDGTMILDHEICFMNGDMNYRINLQRGPVMKLLEKGEIDKLLEFDQLLTQLKRNPGFRLRPFSESPITFKPTYKYDVGTDNYDTSEKKRTPAWCDRIYYRGPGKITPVEYRTHDVRVSDHRPVSGVYDVSIKTVDQELRKEALKRASHRWDKFVEKSITQARMHFHENEGY
ncbi:hypothetical protein BZA70DRAFT_277090 [Myxozyma melibiosi]|uniref:Inositol polyphosphate-related phosphatase domain-containing protein n=1 Tax=Myxozyma melibiosi TaxID=54550 RepID=A0ABR1F7J1_9ASCO